MTEIQIVPNNTTKLAYSVLATEEKYDILALWKKAVNGKLQNKKVICRTPFHPNPIVHCILEHELTTCGCQVVKKPKKGSYWPWPSAEPIEKIRALFEFGEINKGKRD
jgi:hypothetical protein